MAMMTAIIAVINSADRTFAIVPDALCLGCNMRVTVSSKNEIIIHITESSYSSKNIAAMPEKNYYEKTGQKVSITIIRFFDVH